MIKTVGVVGAGTMGNGIAQVFAQSGFSVILVDIAQPMLDRARGTIETSLARFVEKGKLSAADRDATLARLVTTTTLDRLVGADYIVEAILEDVEAKRALFTSLDAIATRDAILASNTSSISITTIGAATKRPEKVLGMHFMNPVPLMTLVELIRGQATSVESMAVASDVCRALGKTPVEAADYPGFIANRILMPMINELRRDGRRGNCGRDRLGDEARDEPSDGTARARRLHRPRRLPRDHERAARRSRRSEVPAVSTTASDGRCRTSRAQVGQRFLHVLATTPTRSARVSRSPARRRAGSAPSPTVS
jgi:3-hydroxybutyryl-CoA dehydrogenase